MKLPLFLTCLVTLMTRPFVARRRIFVVTPNYEDTSYLGDAGPLGLNQPVKKGQQR